MTDQPMDYLECPCCGLDGAYSDESGFFHDGAPLICGCPGHVSIDDADSDDVSVDIWIDDSVPCSACAQRGIKWGTR